MNFFKKKDKKDKGEKKEKKSSMGGFFKAIKKGTLDGMKVVGDKSKELYSKGKEKMSKKDKNEPNTDYPEYEQTGQ
jgi:hypothetical protein